MVGKLRNKLTERKVTKIRRLLLAGYSQADIARIFNVSQACINAIHLGKTWKIAPKGVQGKKRKAVLYPFGAEMEKTLKILSHLSRIESKLLEEK